NAVYRCLGLFEIRLEELALNIESSRSLDWFEVRQPETGGPSLIRRKKNRPCRKHSPHWSKIDGLSSRRANATCLSWRSTLSTHSNSNVSSRGFRLDLGAQPP